MSLPNVETKVSDAVQRHRLRQVDLDDRSKEAKRITVDLSPPNVEGDANPLQHLVECNKNLHSLTPKASAFALSHRARSIVFGYLRRSARSFHALHINRGLLFLFLCSILVHIRCATSRILDEPLVCLAFASIFSAI